MRLRDSGGADNHIIPVSNGVLRPPHVERIGPALPLLLLFEDMVTDGDGADGLVHRGKPVTDTEIGTALGVPRHRILEWRRRLEQHGYISAKRTPHGHTIRVHRSKKWASIKAHRRQELPSADVPVCDVGRPHITARSDGGNPPGDVRKSSTRCMKTAHLDQTKAVDSSRTVVKEPRPLHPAWKTLGVESPIGHPMFQGEWEAWYEKNPPNGRVLSQVAEEFIQFEQRQGKKIPPPFFAAKRRLEDHEKDQALTAKSESIEQRMAAAEATATRYGVTA